MEINITMKFISKNSVLTTLTVLALSTVGFKALAQNSDMKDHDKMAKTKVATPSEKMHDAMMAPMKNMGKLTGDVDRDFATMMLAHHKSAVVMAQLELKYGKNPELKKMSKAIIKSQSAEIIILKKHAKMKH